MEGIGGGQMDPPTEILEGASPSPTDGKAAEDAVSVVLDNGDLLLDIMLRLDLHTSLVRSILVNKRWFSAASDPFLLRHFRRLHPPRLLGLYVATRSTTSHVLLRPRFVPMPPPESDQELAAAVRMAETYSGLEMYDEDFACICDLQNDTLLVSGFSGEHSDGTRCTGVHVHWPLSPHRGVVAVPVIPYEQLDGPTCTIAQFLLKLEQGGRDSLVYVLLAMGFVVNRETREYSVKYKAHVYLLQEDGQWRFRASPVAVLPSPKSDSNPLLVGTKIYLEHSTSIAELDLKTSTFSSIPLPEGMEKYDYKDMMLAPAYDSGIFLLHLDENLQLWIWLRMGGTPDWLPFDVIDLPQMFDTLGMTGWTDDDEPATLFQTTQMGDFLQFVFLKLGQCAFCFDRRRRVLHKLYEVTQEDQTLERIHPLMMTWPPKFPALKGDHLAS